MLFSIIIPTFNRANFILTTIESVLAQTYPNFEIIVVDDGSTDNTEEIIMGIVDKRFRYYKKINEERSIARNYGIAFAKGLYVSFLDSDDILLPNHFEEAARVIEKENKPEWFHLGYKMVNINNQILHVKNNLKKDLKIKLLKENFLSCNGVFLRNDIAIQNLFNTNQDLSASEDYELWFRLAAE